MIETPFSAKTPDSAQSDPRTSDLRLSTTRRPWLIRWLHRIDAQRACISARKQPERNTRNDCNGIWQGFFLRGISRALFVFLSFATMCRGATPEEILRAYGLQRVEKNWLLPKKWNCMNASKIWANWNADCKTPSATAMLKSWRSNNCGHNIKTAEATKTRLATVLKTAPAGQLRTMLERDQRKSKLNWRQSSKKDCRRRRRSGVTCR